MPAEQIRCDLPFRDAIDLPEEPIQYPHFWMMIAEARYPTRRDFYQGPNCIVGKEQRFYTPKSVAESGWFRGGFNGHLQYALLPDSGVDEYNQSSVQLPVSSGAQLSNLVLPFSDQPRGEEPLLESWKVLDLDAHDRRVLSSLEDQEFLAVVSALRYPIADSDLLTAFFHAWFSLPQRPGWRPVLITEEFLQRQKERKYQEMRRHQVLIADEFKRGLLRAVTEQGVPVAVPTAGSFIPIDDARRYLTRRGIPYRERAALEALSQEPFVEGESTEKKKKQPGVAYLSPEQHAQIVAMYRTEKRKWENKQNGGIRAYRQLVADTFDIDPRYVTELANKASAAERAQEEAELVQRAALSSPFRSVPTREPT